MATKRWIPSSLVIWELVFSAIILMSKTAASRLFSYLKAISCAPGSVGAAVKQLGWVDKVLCFAEVK